MNADDKTLLAKAAQDLHQHFCAREQCHRAPGLLDEVGRHHAYVLRVRIMAAVEVSCDVELR